VEDLKDDRRVAGHPAELLPILGFGYGEPTPREEKHLKRYGLGTEIVALTGERGTDFRMVDNYGTISAGPGNVAKGPLENLSPRPSISRMGSRADFLRVVRTDRHVKSPAGLHGGPNRGGLLRSLMAKVERRETVAMPH
jgi:hypothetical protein